MIKIQPYYFDFNEVTQGNISANANLVSSFTRVVDGKVTIKMNNGDVFGAVISNFKAFKKKMGKRFISFG